MSGARAFELGGCMLQAAGLEGPEGPWSGAMLMGLGGGIGLSWDLSPRGLRLELLGTTAGLRTAILRGLEATGARVSEHAPRSSGALVDTVDECLAQGQPVLMWPRRAAGVEPVLVRSRIGAAWQLDGGEVDPHELAAASRGQPIAWVGGSGRAIDLEEDAAEIVRKTCYAHLVQPARTRGLPALRRWFEALDRGAEGWDLGDPGARGTVRRSLHQAIVVQADGTAWRGSYARFLTELAHLADNEDIIDQAEQIDAVARTWADIAELSGASSDAVDDAGWASFRRELSARLRQAFEGEIRAMSALQNAIY